ncbi:methyl-accepting chemotaxis protein [Caballeronia concitans]|uniref:methyl-accepting chemotaxis protein n=1 Tax=Caballeronia concitans TaxID=1777133 RepID=UPI00058929E4|nr:methyl-accepting chemotaxis protein [Caballeronia concitans]
MRRLTFKAKLLCAVAFTVAGLVAVAIVGAVQERSILVEQRRIAMEEQIDAALSVINNYAKESDSGHTSVESAQAAALAHLRMIRFGKSGYFSIVDSEPKLVLMPVNPSLEGKHADFVDPNGKHLVLDILQHARDGTYITYYMWPRPGSDTRPVPKMTFGKQTAWGWTIYTGDYIDDIDVQFRAILVRSLAIVAAIAAALVVGMSLLMRSVLRTIGGDPAYVAQVCERIAEGDISERVVLSGNDSSSLLYSMRTMQTRLAEAIRQIHSSADAITSASREIADGNMDLSSRTEEQAASLAETASSMEELTSTVRQNADNAQKASQLMAKASLTVQEGGKVVSGVIGTMSDIAASSARTKDIIGVIEGIAFQTNILALNAAVEAARAGDHGRGFAVVASEVRNLAQRSAAAAKDVKTLIDSSGERVTVGETYARQAGETMDAMLREVSQVTSIMEEISAASSEQSRGIEHAGVAVSQMDAVTQQNAALVEQSTAATRALADQAAGLRQTVSAFTV